jgi:signal transduction histidine kinase
MTTRSIRRLQPNAVVDADRLTRLQQLTDATLAHLRLDDLLAALLARVREALEVDTCAVLLLDEDRDELVARAAAGLEAGLDAGARIPVGEGFAGRVAAERRPVILEDVDHADVLNPILREKRVRSLLGVPLVVGSRVLGVLHVGTLAPRSFDAGDVELLQLAGDRAAIAIEHARLYEAELAARTRIERVQAVTDAALAHLELDELLEVLLPRIREILEADTCAVLLLDPDRNELVARAAVGLEEEVEAGVRIPLGRGFAGRIAARQRPVILDDLDHADVLNPILREKGIKSLLGVPLVCSGDSIGVLHVGSLTHRSFTSDETDLLRLVADRVAIAIERARLHEEVVVLDQLKLNFVAIASHELRTPATSVFGVLATLVERGDALPEETREELLHVGYEQAGRLTRLIEQLLDLSRLDARAIPVAPRRVALRRLLADLVADLVPEQVPLQLDVPESLAVRVDPLVIERVVSNLLLNAVRHGGPPILLSAEQRDRHLRVVVEDGGDGVPEELHGRLFERFERGTDARGSGLGLAIARMYARAHGGELLYDAGAQGARFELVVPQA